MHHLSSVFSSFAGHGDDDAVQETGLDDPPDEKRPMRRSSFLKRPFNVFKRRQSDSNDQHAQALPAANPDLPCLNEHLPEQTTRARDQENSPRRAIPSLPRPQTFRRQESERRDRLLEVQPSHSERRTLSADRRHERGLSVGATRRPVSPKPVPLPSTSAPSITQSSSHDTVTSSAAHPIASDTSKSNQSLKDLPPLQIPDDDPDDVAIVEESFDDEYPMHRTSLEEDFDRRWILNLSMQFRDKSNREKFFVTYAEQPNLWRRVTVSLDYRDAPEDSLEADLSTLHYQRDKSLRIYEAIRESLPDIQYYKTVTNLKLQTTPDDNQLHVHVREDANEVIEYPQLELFHHISCPRFNETSIDFDSHLSGFVYKVFLGDRVVIKKEIPGPDTVDEFLYEVNALDSLSAAENVVKLEGLVTDKEGGVVKGLLISYAAQGALVDMIFDCRPMPWHRREKWALQIVNGLAEVHEAGFVQGDFTLSNIVIDDKDDAQIIDINRRGCPVGWEPPELGRLIESGQRVGMCIGVKTDLYQLGMVLWALAEEVDEPERVERPLPDMHPDIPQYYRDLVRICLSERPQGRRPANELLKLFPATAGHAPASEQLLLAYPAELSPEHSTASDSHRLKREYIDPAMAVTIDDVKDSRRPELNLASVGDGQVVYLGPDSDPTSSTYHFDSNGSWVIGRRSHHTRGRSRNSSRRELGSVCSRDSSSVTSLSERSPVRTKTYEDYSRLDIGTNQDDGIMPPPLSPHLDHPSACGRVATVHNEEATRRLVFDKRLTALQHEGAKPTAELQHVDSGFDGSFDDAWRESSGDAMRDSGDTSTLDGTLPAYENAQVSDRLHMQDSTTHDTTRSVDEKVVKSTTTQQHAEGASQGEAQHDLTNDDMANDREATCMPDGQYGKVA